MSKGRQKILGQRVRSVYWKWAAKHEDEELKEGPWLEPGPALVRKKKEIGLKSIEMWPGRSFWREVGRKKDYSMLWMVGQQSVSSLPDGGRHRESQALPLSGMARKKAGYSGVLQKVGAKGENVEERMKVATRRSRAPSLSESQWNRGHFSVTKWESKKHRSWCMPVEGSTRGMWSPTAPC